MVVTRLCPKGTWISALLAKNRPYASTSSYRYGCRRSLSTNTTNTTGTSGKRTRITGGRNFNMKYLWFLPALTFCLGTWQVYRLQWKTDVIAQAEQVFHSEPIPMPPTAELLGLTKKVDASGNDTAEPVNEFRRVKVKGRVHPTRFILVGPRARSQDSEPGATGAPYTGYYVVAPFKRADDHEVILVNLGFVPKEHGWVDNRHIPREIEVEGILRDSEGINSFTVKNRPDRNEWLWLILPEMASALRTQPIMLELLDLPGTNYDKIRDDQGLPDGRKTFKGIRNNHFEYLCTWYGLTAIGVFLMVNIV